jgi:hypothetical protein
MDSKSNKEIKPLDMIVIIAIYIYLTHFMWHFGLALLICWKWFSKKYNELRDKWSDKKKSSIKVRKCFVSKASSAAPESPSAFANGLPKVRPKPVKHSLKKVWIISPHTFQRVEKIIDPNIDECNRYHHITR